MSPARREASGSSPTRAAPRRATTPASGASSRRTVTGGSSSVITSQGRTAVSSSPIGRWTTTVSSSSVSFVFHALHDILLVLTTREVDLSKQSETSIKLLAGSAAARLVIIFYTSVLTRPPSTTLKIAQNPHTYWHVHRALVELKCRFDKYLNMRLDRIKVIIQAGSLVVYKSTSSYLEWPLSI